MVPLGTSSLESSATLGLLLNTEYNKIKEYNNKQIPR